MKNFQLTIWSLWKGFLEDFFDSCFNRLINLKHNTPMSSLFFPTFNFSANFHLQRTLHLLLIFQEKSAKKKNLFILMTISIGERVKVKFIIFMKIFINKHNFMKIYEKLVNQGFNMNILNILHVMYSKAQMT